MPLGRWNTPASLGIAAAKALLIAYSFMNLRKPDPLLQLACGAALLWVAFMFTLTFVDLASRSEVSIRRVPPVLRGDVC
ncbi:cytochrome C oxidase subunit IV family protein [Muricoccus vinaceus]|uniref:Cytochrome C oxidase subunit IV family protein n=1 Tax=Muricoccus vinaceus TaxID=424704 RepID=A0ABV6IWY7_9PROT